MARLFVAVRPPADVLGQLAGLRRPVEAGVKWVPAEQWHVTVRFLGEAAVEPVVAALTEAAPAFAALPPAWTTLGPRVSRLGRAVVCIPAAGLDELAAVVTEATREVGDPPDPRPFAGHLTLARLRGRGACGLAGHVFEACFAVTEIQLVRSLLSDRGARHEVVRTFPLAGG